MKRILSFLLTGAVLISSNLQADVDFQDLGPTDLDGLKEGEGRGPFKFELIFDAVAEAKVKDSRHRLQFATVEAELSAVFYHNACYEEGASIGVSYNGTRIDWHHNDFFKQKNFDEVCLTLGFSSARLCDWLWQAQLSANFDNLESWSFSDYMNYDMMLWGRYNYREIGINLGFIALTGMKIDRVYPIFGVDWRWSEKWKLNLVFPVNISLEYNFNKAWTAMIAGRLFFERHRLKRSEVLNKGLIVYTTAGAEAGISYKPKEWLFANIHLGYDFGGSFKTADMHYKNRRKYNVEGAPYAGFEVDYAF